MSSSSPHAPSPRIGMGLRRFCFIKKTETHKQKQTKQKQCRRARDALMRSSPRIREEVAAGRISLLSLVVSGNPRKAMGRDQMSDTLWTRKHGHVDDSGWHAEAPSATNALKKMIQEAHLACVLACVLARFKNMHLNVAVTHAPQCCGYNRNYRRVCAQCVSVCGHSFYHACHALHPPVHSISPWA